MPKRAVRPGRNDQMTPEDALALATQAFAAEDGPEALVDALPLLGLLSDGYLAGGLPRLERGVGALTLPQRRMISRWLATLDRAQAAIDAEATRRGVGADKAGKEIESQIKRDIAARVPVERHREKLFVCWRALRKQMSPSRAFVYFALTLLVQLRRGDVARWSLDVLETAHSGAEQASALAALHVIHEIRKVWDQRQAAQKPVILGARNREARPRLTLAPKPAAEA